ncbi:ribosome maturation factor RimM [Synechocystis sp. LKSZ1]|uniref:ribosome maturation factor RimM n=1 Tax=Synechocystis sp. LKSZ1 TaxID=3144951 RepID=UPI00336C16F3
MAEDWLEIGTIVAPQGIQGELRVLSSSDFPQRFQGQGQRWLQSPQGEPPRAVQLTSGRPIPGKNLFVVRLAEVKDRNQAEQLVGYRLLITADDRLPLDDDEYHVADLINLAVYHQASGAHLGIVVDVYEAGNTLLEVQLADGEHTPPKTVLIPFVQAIVPVVDLSQGRLEILPPAGLLELGNSNHETA